MLPNAAAIAIKPHRRCYNESPPLLQTIDGVWPMQHGDGQVELVEAGRPPWQRMTSSRGAHLFQL